MNGQDDRAAILARRNLLVSSAMGLLACSSQNGTGDTSSVVVPPPATTDPQPTATAIARDPVRARPSWSEFSKAAPPLDVPNRVISAREAEFLGNHATATLKLYETLGAIWESTPPACDLRTCEAKWNDAAQEIAKAQDHFRGPLCGWGGETPAIYIERYNAASGFLQLALGTLEQELESLAKKSGASEDWQRMRRGTVRPQPCLSCMRPTEPDSFAQSYVLFAEGSSTLDKSPALDVILGALQQNPALRITLRGHADKAEPVDHETVSKARAAAVREHLIGAGIASNRIATAVLGADLMIESPHGQLRGRNRRVDVVRAP